jgi:hypothetical protein
MLVALTLFSHGDVSAQIGGAEQSCINELNKGFAKVVKARGKSIGKCIKDATKTKLDPGMTLEECLSADRGGKVAKAEQKERSKVSAA